MYVEVYLQIQDLAGPTFDMLIRFDRHTSFLCLCREGKLKLALWTTLWLWPQLYFKDTRNVFLAGAE